jgi:hypothetical protein
VSRESRGEAHVVGTSRVRAVQKQPLHQLAVAAIRSVMQRHLARL